MTSQRNLAWRWAAAVGLTAAVTGGLAGCESTTEATEKAAQKTAAFVDTYAVHRNKGFEKYRAGDYAGAAVSFKAAADRNGADIASHYWWATSLMNLEDYDGAQLPLEQAWALAPDDARWTSRIIDRLAEVYFQQGRYEKLHAMLADVTRQYHQRSRDFQRQGYYLLKTGDMDGAKLALTKAANFAEPGDAHPYVSLAAFYESVGDPEAAKLNLRYAYFIDPEYEDLAGRLLGYGVVLGPAAGLEPPRVDLVEVPVALEEPAAVE